jgi:MFS family permease
MARDLRLFYLFRLLSTSYLFVPIEWVFATSRGLKFTEIMVLNSIYCLVVILTEVPTGALADHLGRRAAMRAGSLAMIAACATWYLADTFAIFALGSALAAVSMTLCSGADSAYLFDLLNDHGRRADYARSEGTASAWHQGGQALAFAAGGLLAMHNLALPYLVTAGVASIAFVVALCMRADRPDPARAALRPADYAQHLLVSIDIVASRRRLLWAIAYSAVVFVLLRTTFYVYQPYLRDSGFNLAQTGFIFAGVYLAAAAVAHRADALRRRFAEPALLWGLLLTICATFIVLGGITGPWCLLVLVIQAPANGLYSPLVKPLLNHEIPDSRRRATVLSVESMVRRALFAIVSPLVGYLLDRFGPSTGLTLCGIAGLLGAGVLALSSRQALVSVASNMMAAPVTASKKESAG